MAGRDKVWEPVHVHQDELRCPAENIRVHMAARVEGPRARAEVVQLCRELCSSHAERAARGDQVDRPLYSESDEVSLKDSQQLTCQRFQRCWSTSNSAMRRDSKWGKISSRVNVVLLTGNADYPGLDCNDMMERKIVRRPWWMPNWNFFNFDHLMLYQSLCTLFLNDDKRLILQQLYT